MNNAYHLSYEENSYHKNEHEHKEVSSQSEKHQVTRWKLMLQKQNSCQKKKIFVEEARFHQQDSISYSRNKIPLSGLKSCVRNINSLAVEKSMWQEQILVTGTKFLLHEQQKSTDEGWQILWIWSNHINLDWLREEEKICLILILSPKEWVPSREAILTLNPALQLQDIYRILGH